MENEEYEMNKYLKVSKKISGKKLREEFLKAGIRQGKNSFISFLEDQGYKKEDIKRIIAEYFK